MNSNKFIICHPNFDHNAELITINKQYIALFNGIDYDINNIKYDIENGYIHYDYDELTYTHDIFYLLFNFNKHLALNTSILKITIIHKKSNIFNTKIIIELNKSIINKHLEQNTMIEYNLILLIINILKQTFIKSTIQTRYNINKILTPIKYENNSKFEYPTDIITKQLYNYQKENVKWMIDIENIKTKQNIDTTFTSNFIKLDNILINIEKNEIMSIHKYKKTSITFLGGGLIDETGLGKTISTLTLCVMNPPLEKFKINEQLVSPPKNNDGKIICCATLLNGNNKGKICGKKVYNETSSNENEKKYCKTHYTKNNNDITQKIDFKLRKDLWNKIFISSNNKYRFINTNATLIISPNHLCEQWKQEIENTLTNKPNVCLITTTIQHKKYRFLDIINADFVIVSYNLLCNNFHKQLYNNYRILDNNIQILNSYDENIINTNIPPIPIFNWYRIIIDEFHEIYQSDYILSKIIFELKSTYRWILSGTPFANGEESYFNMIKFLGNGINNYKDNANIQNYVANKLFRRNEKQSVKHEFILPPINEINYWLTLSRVEQGMYDKYLNIHKNITNDIYLRQLCCHPNISADTREILDNCKSLDEIKDAMVNDSIKQIDEIIRKINTKEKRLITINNLITNPNLSKDEKTELIIEKRTISRILNSLKNNLTAHKSGIRYFQTIIPTIEQDELGDDPISLDPINKNNIGLTKCGHLYDYNTLKELVQTFAKCAICNAPLSPDTIYKIQESQILEEKNNNINKNIQKLINTHGTKMAHLITDLNEMIEKTDEHAIIFSQWDNLLTKIEITLKNNNINTAICRGNVYMKNNAIKKFNNNTNHRIILLSSENAASGINLTKASRVYILDPIYGDEEYRVSVETQALGRAYRLGQTKPVSVIRYLIKNTVEHNIFELSYKTKLGDAMNKIISMNE